MARGAQKQPHPARVRVGQRVGFSFGGRRHAARVIEDRGNLGARGQQVVRLAVEDDTDNHEVEVPVDWLEPAPRP